MKSLFTGISQQMTLKCVKDVLDGSNVIIGDSNLKPDSVLNLTKISAESTFFQFKQEIYKQIQGTPMGFPVSVVLSEMTLLNIENQIIQNSPAPIVLWKRYIDDIINCCSPLR